MNNYTLLCVLSYKTYGENIKTVFYKHSSHFVNIFLKVNLLLFSSYVYLYSCFKHFNINNKYN